MSHLSKSELIDIEGAPPPSIIRTVRETYLVTGREVTDSEALAQLDMPGDETVVEVSSALRSAMKEHHAAVDS